MKYPKCPSCGYELYDSTDQCPFCGTDLPRRSILPSSTGFSSGHRAKLIVVISIILAVAGGAFTYYLAMWNEKASVVTEKISEQFMPQDTNAQQCIENMYRILDAENEYMSQNGRFADNIDELAQFDSTLNIVCPESGLSYTIINTKQSVQVRCSVHGEI